MRAASSAKAGGSNLMATSRFSLVSGARYTAPIPAGLDVIRDWSMVEGWVMSAGLHGTVSLPDQRAGRASAITCGEPLESCVTGRKTRVTGKCLAHSIPEAGRLAEVECWREQPYRPTTGQTP